MRKERKVRGGKKGAEERKGEEHKKKKKDEKQGCESSEFYVALRERKP